jgi:hypothetical protein
LNVRKFLAGFVACLALIGWVSGVDAALKAVAPGVAATFTASSQFLAANGTAALPGYAFTSAPTTGMYQTSGGYLGFSVSGTADAMLQASNGWVVRSDGGYTWSSTTDPTAGPAVSLVLDAANAIAQKNGANAQSFRIYNTTTGPIYLGITARTAGGVFTGSGGAMQLSTAQTTAPTCTTNCGTSPSITGTDTFMTVNMGATGSPASGWVVTFNGTWPAAPSCTVQMAKAGMVVGKMALTAVTTTTTITVVTNGTAPATADMYHIHCGGLS